MCIIIYYVRFVKYFLEENFMEYSTIINLFEAFTIFCFGLSWPISIRKSYISRTAKGKSLFFEIFLIIGYAFGIARKFIQLSYLGEDGFLFYLSFFFYLLNFVEIAVDIALYFRNKHLDNLAAKEVSKKSVLAHGLQ